MSVTVSLIGYLAKEPELNYLTSGKVVWKTSVPVQSTSKSAEGEYPTNWYQLVAWGELAERLVNQKYPNGDSVFGKGAYVNVLGKLQPKTYMGADGVQKTQLEVTVVSVETIKTKTAGNQEDKQKAYSNSNGSTKTAVKTNSKPVIAPVADDDDIPF